MADRVGEVIESDSTAFQAQCYRLHEPPALGSLVLVPDGDVEVVGVVSEAGTSSIQPGRKPLARGEDETSVEGFVREQPTDREAVDDAVHGPDCRVPEWARSE